ncbi:MAG: 50S ribosomal protein L5 [Nitrospiraceae bacterium]|nr:50S ribosomal protein L5 [Nitrospiraceae bacterium]
MNSGNVCDNLRIEKVTLNMGCGRNADRMDKAIKLFEKLTNQKAIKTLSKKRIPAWDLRINLPIGVKVTVRGKKAEELLDRLLKGIEELKSRSFDNKGNFSFGIKEYISIPGIEYDHDIGLLGFDVCVTLERIGYRVKRRRLHQKKLPNKKRVSKEDAIKFVEEKFNKKVLK